MTKKVKILLLVVFIQGLLLGQVEVTLPDTVISGAGGADYLPIKVSNVPAGGISNFNLWISFDNSVINISDATKEGTLVEDWSSFSSFLHGDDQYRIGALSGGSGTVSSSGTIAKIYIEYVDTGTTELIWDKCFLAEDKEVSSNPVNGSITIQSNQKPIFVNARLDTTIKENQTLDYNFSAEDPEGESVQYSLLDAPSGATISSFNGVFSWETGFNDAGEYEFVVEATDGEMIGQDSVFVTVLDSNRVPTIINSIGDTSIYEGEELIFNYQASDPDEDDLEFALVDSIEGLMVSLSGELSWTPNSAQIGTHTVVVSVDDGSATVYDTSEVEVMMTNRSPAFTATMPDTNINEGQLLTYTYAASDTNDDDLTFSLASSISGMEVTSSGELSWTPSYDQAGTYEVIVSVSDGSLSTNDTAEVEVADVNPSPVFTDVMPDTTITEGESLIYDYNASDENDASLSFSLVSSMAEMDITSDGEFSWTPGYEDAGVYNVVVAVSDGETAVNDTAVVTVEEANRAPESFSLLSPEDGDTVVVNNNSDYLQFMWESSFDPDGDSLIYLLETSLFDTSMVWSDTSVSIADGILYNVMDSLNQNTIDMEWFVKATDGIDTTESEERFQVILKKEVVAVENMDEAVPQNYALHQNYPNPFNPATKIAFDLPKESKVLLEIYNLKGDLVNSVNFGAMQAGTHNYIFNASQYSSGIFIYKLEADNFTAIKKMTLIK